MPSMSSLRIVGANGSPKNTVGWLIPIVKDDSGRCFLLGQNPNDGFPANELSALAQTRRIVPFPNERILDSVPTMHGATMLLDRDREFLGCKLGWFVVYRARERLQAAGLKAEWDEFCTQSPDATVLVENKEVELFLLERQKVQTILARLFDRAASRVRSDLKALVFRDMPYQLQAASELEDEAKLLSQLAFKRDLAERAILYRAIPILLGPQSGGFWAWLKLAVKGWGLPDTAGYWLDRLQSEVTSLWFEQMVVGILEPELREPKVKPRKVAASETVKLSQRGNSIGSASIREETRAIRFRELAQRYAGSIAKSN